MKGQGGGLALVSLFLGATRRCRRSDRVPRSSGADPTRVLGLSHSVGCAAGLTVLGKFPNKLPDAGLFLVPVV